MKKSLALLAAVNNFYLLAKKYIILKTLRLSSAEGATYYSTYEDTKEGYTIEPLILLMEQNETTMNFQISKSVF
jgi:hypothetical protein